jgi:ADP-ribose pyrophosphatase
MKDKDLTNPAKVSSLLKERPLTSEQVFDGKLLQVYSDEVELPDKTTSTREWIKHPGASAVVPVFEDGTIMLLKQFRYPARNIFIEVPAGKIDPGETADSTAGRELLEESGVECSHLVQVGSFYPAIGYADEIIYSYVAWGLKMHEQDADDDEFLLNYRIPFSKAMKMIQTGEITDGKTICTLLHASSWWKKNVPFDVDFE